MRAFVEERRIAQRLWSGGTPRKDIARLLNVSEHTVKDWRYRDNWPVRSGNHHEQRDPSTYRPKSDRERHEPTCWRCEGCGGRALSAEGHPKCLKQEVA